MGNTERKERQLKEYLLEPIKGFVSQCGGNPIEEERQALGSLFELRSRVRERLPTARAAYPGEADPLFTERFFPYFTEMLEIRKNLMFHQWVKTCENLQHVIHCYGVGGKIVNEIAALLEKFLS